MIQINHKKQLVYVRTLKTGGVSINHILRQHDFHGHEYRTRKDHKQLYGCRTGPENMKQVGVFDYYSTWPEFNKKCNMTPDKYIEYTKICVIRDPFDRFVSGYDYMKSLNYTTHPTLDEYIKSKDLTGFEDKDKHVTCFWHTHVSQCTHLSYLFNPNMGPKIVLDFKHLSKFPSLVGVPGPLPRLNSSTKKSELTPFAQAFIQKNFQDDIKLYKQVQEHGPVWKL